MGAPNQARQHLPEGFEGEVSGLGLADLIQLCVQSRFSGCVTVKAGQRSGLVYFRDGQIVHAERGDLLGDQAFYAILRWTGGRFSLQPNVMSARASIDKNWQFLLLEAHRLIDEAGHDPDPDPEPAPPEPAAKPGAAPMERLRQIPGVVAAVLQRTGAAPLADDTHEAEILAGNGLYLAMVGRQLGSLLRAGDIRSATVEGSTQHLLLFATTDHCLSISVRGDAPVRAVETEVRKALGGR